MQKKGIVLRCQGNPVSCYGKRAVEEAEAIVEAKRGIVLKCQGNPVSCYGKRSASEGVSDYESNSVTEEDESYERFAKALIKSCNDGLEKSCDAVLRIMLMNSN